MRRAGLRTRRRYRRITLSLDVEYRSEVGARKAIATTLGAGGLFIRTEHPLLEGAEIEIGFELPGGTSQHQVRGRVVWSQPPAREAGVTPGMGIAFTDKLAISKLARELDAIGPD